MTVHVTFPNHRWFINCNKIHHGVYFPEICHIYEDLFGELDHVERITRDNGKYIASVIVVT